MTTESDDDNTEHAIKTVLDKKPDGTFIELDWNAFEAATALKEPEIKDIHSRVCSEYDYNVVKNALRRTVHKKRAEILSLAKDKVMLKVLQECQVLNLVTSNQVVSSKDLLRKWLKETSGKHSEKAIRQFTETCFRESARWNDDMAHELMDTFGIRYDPTTVNPHSNNKGNGFMEKICTKALQNVRQDLRAIRDRARIGNPAPRIKRSKDDCHDKKGRYIRRKPEVSVRMSMLIWMRTTHAFLLFLGKRSRGYG